MEKEIILYLQNVLSVSLAGYTREEMRIKVHEAIQHLIEYNFQKLVEVLYRVDVDERKLKRILSDNKNKDAAIIIGDLIIERQLEKWRSRNELRAKDDNIPEGDKW
jgi:ribosomal protein L18